MRSCTSFSTRSAIMRSRSDSSRPPKNSAASRIDIAQTSAMFRPLIVTASESGFSRAPPHAWHGTSRIQPSICSRIVSLSASVCRRCRYGTTPS